MATEYKLSYTASEINKKLSRIDNLAEKTEVHEHNTDTNAHANIREEISQLSSEKVDISDIVQNSGDSTDKVMSQAAVTSALEALTTLPYGGSKEWLEDNGDISQLYQIDGYVWAYIDSTGWTKGGTRFLVVSSESEMTNEGGTAYLLRNGDSGTVYSYTEASGDSDTTVVDSIPDVANDGDVITIKPTEVNSTNAMTDTSKQYAMGGKVYAHGEFNETINVNEQIFDPSKVQKWHMSGTANLVTNNSYNMYLMHIDVSQIPEGADAYVEIEGLYLRNTTSPYIEKIGYSPLENPVPGTDVLLSNKYADANTMGDSFVNTSKGCKLHLGYVKEEKITNWDDIKTLMIEVPTAQTHNASEIKAYLQYSYNGTVAKWYDTGISVGRKYEATVSGSNVTWTDVGTYVEPKEASWDATNETKNIVDSLSETAISGYVAVYSVDGYTYTYLDGASWMQSSKYTSPTLSIDGELSFASKNAIQNSVVTVAIDAVQAKANSNAKEIDTINTRIANIETGSDTVTIPEYWEDAVAEVITKIKALQVGRNCVTFPFFSDNHQRNGYAGLLISHIMKECHIPYCFFGGDSISSGKALTANTEAEMIAQDKAFDASMSYIPNGKFCRAVGNHDGFLKPKDEGGDGIIVDYSRDKIYDLFLREESVAQNKHFGGEGTYYYVDEISSKVRFIVLDTNDSVDAEQINWIKNTALSFNESGWAVVFISHQPISNHYHAGISNVPEVVSAVVSTSTSQNIPIVGWFSGHVHRDIITTRYRTGGNGSNAGTEVGDLGFTQVIITSDNTGIAYDESTKHEVDADDQSHAIDFVTINKATRTVNITRLGIGEDRSYTY